MENTKTLDLESFRSLLQNNLIERCRENPGYSMRAYARSLGVDQSTLSRILRGQRDPSKKLILRIGQELGLSTEKLEGLLKPTKLRAKNATPISFDMIAVLSDWYHFAILELTQLPHFQSDANWIAKTLGITQGEVNIAIDRLYRCELLSTDQNGSLVATTNNINWVNSEMTSEARRNLQKQFLKLAIQAIQNVDFYQRENGSLTIAVDRELIPEIKQKITQFRIDLRALIESRKTYTDVYQLAVAFFPLTKNLEGVEGE